MIQKGMICIFVLTLVLSLWVNNVDAIKFKWDCNTEGDLASYSLYQGTTSGDYTFGKGNEVKSLDNPKVGAPPPCSEALEIPDPPDGEYFWVVTAFDKADNESGPSNEVSAVIDTVPPADPLKFRIDSCNNCSVKIDRRGKWLVIRVGR